MTNNKEFDEFTTKLLNLLPSYTDGFMYELTHPAKNNSTTYNGLVVKKIGNNIAPVMNLDELYNFHKNRNMSLKVITKGIMAAYYDTVENNRPFSSGDIDDLSWSNCRNRVYIKLVNKARNQEFCKDLPTYPVKYTDDLIGLYVVSCGDIDRSTNCFPAFRLNDMIWNIWQEDVDEDTLAEIALRNTRRLFPMAVARFGDVVFEALNKMGIDDTDMEDEFEEPPANSYIMSNVHTVYGATVMLYPDFEDFIWAKFDGACYILPSSVHELIVLGDLGDGCSPSDLNVVINEVNKTDAVALDEYLLDHYILCDLREKNE